MHEFSAARPIATATVAEDEDLRDGWEASRQTLFRSPLGLVEKVRCRAVQPRTSWDGYSPEFQVCLPYRGLFVWHVEGEDVVCDSNRVLFVSGSQPFRLRELAGEAVELIITPSPVLLADLLHVAPTRLASHPLFRGLHRPADLRMQLLRGRFLHRASSGAWDDLAVEELLVATLRGALQAEAPHKPSLSTSRLIRRTKEFVEAHLSERFLLGDVAHAVGASPAYLTDAFRRFEGVPLHKYTLQSRLARALVELPHADDLTTLALDLGFSSHSHFSAAFRRAFGSPPSEFRRSTRNARCVTAALVQATR